MRTLGFIFMLCFVLPASYLYAQNTLIKKIFEVPSDTNYISTYVTDYTTRIYGSVKYSNLGYNDNLLGKSLSYKPNNKMLLGLGVNHGILGLNIGINFPFMNQDDETYGETKYYDFTMRVFAPRFNATIYLQNYHGYFLRNTADMIPGWEYGDPYYIRGDLRSNTIGLDLYYIFNSTRFSYRAAILQNEWQKKSAGSFLVGGSIIYNTVSADSSITPNDIYYGKFFDDLKFDKSNNFNIGPTIGYAHTFVIKKHIFLMGSLNGSITYGFTQLVPVDNEDKVKSGLVLGFRSDLILSAGYNSDRWYTGLSYVNMSMLTQAPIDERDISYGTGMFRINLVRRFATKKPLKILNP